MSSQVDTPSLDNSNLAALNTLEAQLESEAFFFESVRDTIREKTGYTDHDQLDPVQFKNLVSRGGNDNLLHIAQFYFSLETLGCRTPSQLEALIRSHNDKVRAEMTPAEKAAGKPSSEKFFAANEITQIRLTLDYYGEIVFSLTELGKIMSDLMSTSTTANLLKELVIGGVFEQVGGPALDPSRPEGYEFQGPAETSSKRKLVQPGRKFMEDYKASLLMARDRIRVL